MAVETQQKLDAKPVAAKANPPKPSGLQAQYDAATGGAKWWAGTKLVLVKFLEDQGTMLAAAITYFTLLSIFPLILGVVAASSFVLTDPEVRNNIIKALSEAIPQTSGTGVNISELVNGFIDTLAQRAGILAVFSVLVTLWSGTSIFDQLMLACNILFNVRVDSRNFFYKVFLRLVMLVGVLLVMLLAFGIPLFLDLIKNFGLFNIKVSDFRLLFDVINFLTPTLIIWLMLVVLYRLAPDYKKLRWNAVFLGALVGSILFQISKFALGIYFTSFNGASGYAATFGALAGVVIFLFYVYIIAIILLLGAEVVAVATGVKKPPLQPQAVKNLKVATVEGAAIEQAATGSDTDQPIEPAPVYRASSSPLTMVLSVLTVAAVAALGRGRKPK